MQTSTYGSHDEQGRELHFGCFRRETSEMFGGFRECSRSLGGTRVNVVRDVGCFRRVLLQVARAFSENWHREREGRPFVTHRLFSLRLLPAFSAILRKSRDFSQSRTCTCAVLILISVLYYRNPVCCVIN